jgi:hypothetical protein
VGTSCRNNGGGKLRLIRTRAGCSGVSSATAPRIGWIVSTSLNPSYDRARIAADEQEDPESAAAEYGTAWRVAGGSLVRPEVVTAAIDAGITERAPEPPFGDDEYRAAVDLSGGTGQDSAALSIQHVEHEDDGPALCVQDVLREWTPPFDAAVMAAEIARECARYGITEVIGDQFSYGFAASEFRRHGIAYVVSPRQTASADQSCCPRWQLHVGHGAHTTASREWKQRRECPMSVRTICADRHIRPLRPRRKCLFPLPLCSSVS